MDATIWFPRNITDLDHFQRVYMYGTDLDADHPGNNQEVIIIILFVQDFSDICRIQRPSVPETAKDLLRSCHLLQNVKFYIKINIRHTLSKTIIVSSHPSS